MHVDAIGAAHAPFMDEPRIISLVPSITELLFSLDLGNQVVGRTSFCVHPAAVKYIARVGGTKTPDINKIKGLEPTHLITNIDENRQEDIEALRNVIPHIVVTHPLFPQDNLSLYTLLGSIFNRLLQVKTLCDEFTEAFIQLCQKKRRVLT